MNKPRILTIAGPTASGKSGLALRLATERNGVVINADSMQVYNTYPILSAQPSAADYAKAHHELYSALRPPMTGTAASWVEAANDSINRTLAAGKLPIVVGGTGMYLEFLLHGLSELPDVPEEIRAEVQAEYEANPASVEAKLKAADPTLFARLKPNDKQRTIRAYEVFVATGKPLSEWQSQEFKAPTHAWDHQTIILSPPREKLYAQIDQRFDGMLKAGALDEVKRGSELNLSPDHPAEKTIGVRDLRAYMNGEISLETAKEKASQLSRNYAKRQVTWFKNRFMRKEKNNPIKPIIISEPADI